MVKLQYGQIEALHRLLVSWWSVKGLPLAFQRQVLAAMRAIEREQATLNELKEKAIGEYAKRTEDGSIATREDETVIFADEAAFGKEWAALMTTEFDCPPIKLEDVEPLADKLELTLAKLAILYNEEGKGSLLV